MRCDAREGSERYLINEVIYVRLVCRPHLRQEKECLFLMFIDGSLWLTIPTSPNPKRNTKDKASYSNA